MQQTGNEKKSPKPFAMTLDRREHLTLTGVQNVVSFNEEQAAVNTEGGLLIITGQDLHVARLMLEEGQMVLNGTVDSLCYEGRRTGAKRTLAARLFR